MSERDLFRRESSALVVTLEVQEVEVLGRLVGELLEVLRTSDAANPILQRLFPRAYLDPTEEEAEEQWQSLVHPDLVAARVAGLTALGDELAGAQPSGDALVLRLDEEGVERFLGVLNDARLSLGSLLGVSEADADAGSEELPSDDPAAYMRSVYDWLTYLEGELVEVLLAGLPETGTD